MRCLRCAAGATTKLLWVCKEGTALVAASPWLREKPSLGFLRPRDSFKSSVEQPKYVMLKGKEQHQQQMR